MVSQDAGIELELHCRMTYEDVEAQLAQQLGLKDQRCLRFTAHNVFSQVLPCLSCQDPHVIVNFEDIHSMLMVCDTNAVMIIKHFMSV